MFKKLFKFGGESDFGRTGNIIISLLGLLFVVCFWQFIYANQIISSKILPGPFQVLCSFFSLFSEYNLVSNIWFTVKLNLICYFYSLLISFPIAFCIALIPFLNVFIGRYINALRFTPMTAVTSLFIVIFGLTFSMKVWFLTIAISIFIIPEIVNKINDLQNPENVKDNVYIQTLKTFGANNWQMFRYVYWPYVTSNVASSLIGLLGISYSYVVVAELIYKDGNITGIGSMINTMIRQAKLPEAFALLFIVIVIGYFQDIIFTKISYKLFPYKH